MTPEAKRILFKKKVTPAESEKKKIKGLWPKHAAYII